MDFGLTPDQILGLGTGGAARILSSAEELQVISITR